MSCHLFLHHHHGYILQATIGSELGLLPSTFLCGEFSPMQLHRVEMGINDGKDKHKSCQYCICVPLCNYLFVCLFTLPRSVSYSCVGGLLSGKKAVTQFSKESQQTHSESFSHPQNTQHLQAHTHMHKDKDKYCYFQVSATQGSIYHHRTH